MFVRDLQVFRSVPRRNRHEDSDTRLLIIDFIYVFELVNLRDFAWDSTLGEVVEFAS